MAKTKLRSYALSFFEPDAYSSQEKAREAAKIARERGAAPLLTGGFVFGVPSVWRGPDWYGLSKIDWTYGDYLPGQHATRDAGGSGVHSLSSAKSRDDAKPEVALGLPW